MTGVIMKQRKEEYGGKKTMQRNVAMKRVPATTVVVEKLYFFTYSQCVFVALDIQHAIRMCPIVLSYVGLSGCNTLSHIIS